MLEAILTIQLQNESKEVLKLPKTINGNTPEIFLGCQFPALLSWFEIHSVKFTDSLLKTLLSLLYFQQLVLIGSIVKDVLTFTARTSELLQKFIKMRHTKGIGVYMIVNFLYLPTPCYLLSI